MSAPPDGWEPPWVSWYPADWAGSLAVRAMEPLERLVYREMLELVFRRGRFEWDPSKLSRLLGLDAGILESAWPAIRGQFDKAEGGGWTQHKALRVRLEAWQRSRKAAGGARARWHASAYAQASPKHTAEHMPEHAPSICLGDATSHLTSHISQLRDSQPTAHSHSERKRGERAGAPASGGARTPEPPSAAGIGKADPEPQSGKDSHQDTPEAAPAALQATFEALGGSEVEKPAKSGRTQQGAPSVKSVEKPNRKPPTGPQADLMRWWEEAWEGSGRPPWVWSQKEAVSAARLLKLAGGDALEVQRRCANLLESTDAWMVQNAAPSLAVARWNQLAVQVRKLTPAELRAKEIADFGRMHGFDEDPETHTQPRLNGADR